MAHLGKHHVWMFSVGWCALGMLCLGRVHVLVFVGVVADALAASLLCIQVNWLGFSSNSRCWQLLWARASRAATAVVSHAQLARLCRCQQLFSWQGTALLLVVEQSAMVPHLLVDLLQPIGGTTAGETTAAGTKVAAYVRAGTEATGRRFAAIAKDAVRGSTKRGRMLLSVLGSCGLSSLVVAVSPRVC
jgi:hypothetical protein